MGSFGEATLRALEDHSPLADQRVGATIQLLSDNACEARLVRTMVPEHVEQPAAAVVVMEQRRIESAAVEIDRV
jgi:hypothetical protein